MSEFNLDLTPVLKMAARIVQTTIETQVPVRTGKLKNGIKVYVENEEIVVSVEEDYGAYTDYGTGPYYQGNFGEGWDAGLFEGYRKGQGGIQAQKWSSLPTNVEEEIAVMIDEEIDRLTDIAIEQAINAI
jgi:hypothetical protein